MRICLTGFAGSGKTSVATYLQRHYGFFTYTFAAELKQLFETMYKRKIDKTIDRFTLTDLGQILKKHPSQMNFQEKCVLQSWLRIPEFFEYYIKNYDKIFNNTFWADELFFYNTDFEIALKNHEDIAIHDMRFKVENTISKLYSFKNVRLNASKELCQKRLLERDSGYDIKMFDDISEREFLDIPADLIIDIDENTTIEEIVDKIIRM